MFPCPSYGSYFIHFGYLSTRTVHTNTCGNTTVLMLIYSAATDISFKLYSYTCY